MQTIHSPNRKKDNMDTPNHTDVRINIPDNHKWYLLIEGAGLDFNLVAVYTSENEANQNVGRGQTVRGPVSNEVVTELFVNDQVDK